MQKRLNNAGMLVVKEKELQEVYNDLNKTVNKLYKIAVDEDDKMFLKLNTLISKILDAKFYLDDEILNAENDNAENDSEFDRTLRLTYGIDLTKM